MVDILPEAAEFKFPDFSEISDSVYRNDSDAVKKALRKERLSIDDLGALLSPAASEFLPRMAKRSAELTAMRFGRTIQIYAPLYLSSFCVNRCLYCGFPPKTRLSGALFPWTKQKRKR